jgi:hypothetical protein
MKQCPKCQTLQPSADKFCQECGTELIMVVKSMQEQALDIRGLICICNSCQHAGNCRIQMDNVEKCTEYDEKSRLPGHLTHDEEWNREL